MKTQPFQGRTVLITGASTGIRRAAAKASAAAGAGRVLAARRLLPGEEAARDAEPPGVGVLPVRRDVTRGESGLREHRLHTEGWKQDASPRNRVANPAPKKDA